MVVCLITLAVSGLFLRPYPHRITSYQPRCLPAALCASSVDLSGDGGCVMTILRAPLPSAQRAEEGAFAKVHFLAALANGTVLLDSWQAGEVLEFRVGAEPSETVSPLSATCCLHPCCVVAILFPTTVHVALQTPGCELALARLQVGERVRIDCSPEYAYGERGAPPLIPPHSQMYFELELLSLRDLSSSHNPEEVDFLERYKELTENRKPPASDDPSVAAARPPAPSAGPQMPALKLTSADLAADLPIVADLPGLETPPSVINAPIDVASSTTEGSDATPSPASPVEQLWIAQRARIEGRHVSGYTWQETDEDMEVTCPLPPGTTKEQIQCEIRARSLVVGLQGQPPMLQGALCGRVQVDGSAWSIEMPKSTDGGPLLQVELLKCAPDDRLWGYVLDEDRTANEDLPDDSYLREDEPSPNSLQRPGIDSTS